jgi:hypothetical protein
MGNPIQQAQDFLIKSYLRGMGWGYMANSQQAFPEPTCYSLMALDGTSFSPEESLIWLAGLVQENGQLFLPGDDMPNWVTSILIITLTRLDRLLEIRDVSLNWLIEWKSRTLDDSSDVPVDTTLVGWSWISNTFSWVQPTSLGALALKLSGLGTHERVKEAEVLILDRMCYQGGWNFGNPAILDTPLPPAVVDTAVALFALQDVPRAADAVEISLSVLERLALERPSAFALALSVLCLNIYNRPLGNFIDLLRERQESDGSWRQSILWTALATLALQVESGGKNVFKI